MFRALRVMLGQRLQPYIAGLRRTVTAADTKVSLDDLERAAHRARLEENRKGPLRVYTLPPSAEEHEIRVTKVRIDDYAEVFSYIHTHIDTNAYTYKMGKMNEDGYPETTFTFPDANAAFMFKMRWG